jgi:ubiquinone/menaquinone biosynthesis C-methylase UbiE
VPDAIFAHPRLAALYDVVDDDRSDLDAYAGMVHEFKASTVLDLGCGTGTLACRLAQQGIQVIGIEPAASSLEVARRKPGASAVRWIEGDTSQVPPFLSVDLAMMTANVAQVFVDDDDWQRTLEAIARSVRVGGWLVFETRDPGQRAWRRWTKELTVRRFDTTVGGAFTTWTELVAVEEPLVTFRHVFVFDRDGATLTSESTLRFRTREEIVADLDRAGFETREVRDAPDRPGLEFVFVAQRSPSPPA